MSRVTITAGITELKARQDSTEEEETTRVRRSGGGRKALTETDAELMQTLESLVDPVTRGDPMSPLRWTCKSTRKLSEELHHQKHPVGPRTVATLLRQAGYSLQANRKTREGMACSPKVDPCVMRVRRPARARRTFDARQEAPSGTDYQEAA